MTGVTRVFLKDQKRKQIWQGLTFTLGLAGFVAAVIAAGIAERITSEDGSWYVGIILICLVCVCCLPSVLWLQRRYDEGVERRLPPNICRNCGYDCRASSDSCAECGTRRERTGRAADVMPLLVHGGDGVLWFRSASHC